MSKEITPLKKWILVKPDEESKISKYDLITPDNVEKEQKAIGEILRVGGEVESPLVEGVKIIYGAYAGEKIELKEEKEEYVLIHEDDVLSIVTEKCDTE